jgi:transposase
MSDEALRDLQPRFHKLYAKTGRPSIAPEKLLRALLLQALYSVRSERLLMEQLHYNLLFRWFVGLNLDDAIWDVTVFSRPASGVCSRTSTSPWMERCWKRGRV